MPLLIILILSEYCSRYAIGYGFAKEHATGRLEVDSVVSQELVAARFHNSREQIVDRNAEFLREL